MRRLLLAAALLLAPAACLNKETGKGAETKAGEGAGAGAPIGENRMIDAGAATSTGGPGATQPGPTVLRDAR